MANDFLHTARHHPDRAELCRDQSADDARRGARRGEPVSLLLRRAVHARVPDAHRRSGFIKKIASGNLIGSARVIFDANPIGATCARVCPVEVLCEGACVEKTLLQKPIEIGRLQRYATDHAMTNGQADLHERRVERKISRNRRFRSGRSVVCDVSCPTRLRRDGLRAKRKTRRPRHVRHGRIQDAASCLAQRRWNASQRWV